MSKKNKPWQLHFPGGQSSNDSATDSEVRRFASEESACHYLADIYASDSIKLALIEKRYGDVIRIYNSECESVRLIKLP